MWSVGASAHLNKDGSQSVYVDSGIQINSPILNNGGNDNHFNCCGERSDSTQSETSQARPTLIWIDGFVAPKEGATSSTGSIKNTSGNLDEASNVARNQPHGAFSKIQFGKVQNQVNHAFRYIDKAGFSRADVRTAIQKDLTHSSSSIQKGLNKRFVTVGGVRIDYHAYRMPDGTVNIGRITTPR